MMHLIIGERLLGALCLPTDVRDLLLAQRGAFLLGNIAPDLQAVSGQPRRATHFYSLPLTSDRPVYYALLQTHPELAQPRALPPAQAAFWAGYIAHLLFDEAWVREIFTPVFDADHTWADRSERMLWHNVLRTWIEGQYLAELRNGIAQTLRAVEPDAWLPFASDYDLCRWRDLIADELEPGAALLTAQFFAGRAGVSNDEFETCLQSEQLERHVFPRISPQALHAFHQQMTLRTRDLVVEYVRGTIK